MNLTKICTKCLQEKQSSEFYKEKQAKDGRAYECKECSKARMKALYEANPGMRRRNSTRHKLKVNYGLTPEGRIQMLDACGWKCQICSREVFLPQSGCTTNNANIDHCHKTGTVRGILCGHCNKGLGHFYDNPGLLHRAISYLEKTHDTARDSKEAL